MSDSDARVLSLAPDCDPAVLAITPSEGFLLSRIDGQTPWRVLREMGGMPPEEADLCLESWLARGIVEVDDVRTASAEQRRKEKRARPPLRVVDERSAIPNRVDESLLDENLDLSLEVQKHILEFEVSLSRSYHEILDVARDADAKAIKKAYFRLSKEFHPDRYFRRQIGSFEDRLERIFYKVTEAYEILSDPMARAEVEKSMEAAPLPSPSAGGPESNDAQVAPTPQRPLTARERLRQRMPFKLPASILQERSQKAQEFFHASRVSLAQGNPIEAASSVRLAIAFDPFNDEYKRAFGEVQAEASESRAQKLIAEADSLDATQLRQALRLLEDVLLYRPHDPKVNDKAANVALQLDELDTAFEYSERALDHSPDVAAYHRTLAQIYAKRRELGHAIHALEKALKLDPSDEESKRLMASLRPRKRAAGGVK